MENKRQDLPAVQVAVLADGVAIHRAVLASVQEVPMCRRREFPATFNDHAWPVLEHDLKAR